MQIDPSRHRRSFHRYILFPLAAAASTAGCVLAPPGYDGERERVAQAGERYATPVAEREVPDLPEQPTWRDALACAFHANGELEAAYFEWRAAVERVQGAASWPNSAAMPSFSYMFSGGSMKAWDRTTVNVGFDASENLELPVKTRKAGEVALAEARAAAERFRGAKFDLQRRVLEAWLDLALAEERLRVAQADLELLRMLAATAVPRLQAGGAQQDLVRAGIEVTQAENRVLGLEAQARAMGATLNALLGRDPQAPLALADELPQPRSLPDDDLSILRLGVHGNPRLASLVQEVAGRDDALELARLMYLPNVNPFAGFTGSLSQMVGAAVMLPTELPEIRAGIAEARALLEASRAMARQTEADQGARMVAALVVLRDSEREAELLDQAVLPGAQLLVDTTRQAYAAGSAGLDELIEAQRALLDVRLAVAEARIERERRIAEIEELAGIDVETLQVDGTRSGS